MKRASLYSTSPRAEAGPKHGPEKPVEARAKRKWRDLYSAYERKLLLGAAVLLTLLALSSHFRPAPVASLTQQHIEEAVARALAEQPLPSVASKVYDAVKGSIVRVRASGDALENDEYLQRAVGSGVVVVDRGEKLLTLRARESTVFIVDCQLGHGHIAKCELMESTVLQPKKL